MVHVAWPSDPRIVTAACLMIIGMVFAAVAVRVWWTHPVNRVFFLGDYLTEAGLRALLTNLPVIFAIGAAGIVSGAARAAYWWGWDGAPLLGTLEAIFSIWAAASLLLQAFRLWRAR